jgi:prevent-host-death family protein
VASCGYVGRVKGKNKKYPGPETSGADHLAEAVVSGYEAPVQVNVRAAKDRLSNLLELAAQGHDVVITSDGEPKAKLISYRMKTKKFKVDWALLRSAPVKAGARRAEEIVREERDGRP